MTPQLLGPAFFLDPCRRSILVFRTRSSSGKFPAYQGMVTLDRRR